MPKTKAALGYGAKLGIWNGASYDFLAEITSLTPPGWSRDTVDATHLESPDKTKEFIGGLIEAGEATATINYHPAATDALLDAFTAESAQLRIIFPGGAIALDFLGIVTGYEIGDLVADDKMSATLTIKASGKPAYNVLSAPVNSVLPAISGTPKVDVALTAYVGVWVGATSFAYQWKAGGTNVSGATAASYTPVTGDVGKAITVAITATSAAGSTSATSGATANVASA